MGRLKSKKTIPTYNRPTATGGSVDRVWRTVTIEQLQLGDIVAGKGIVKSIQPTCRNEFYLELGEDNEDIYGSDEQVYAFVKKES